VAALVVAIEGLAHGPLLGPNAAPGGMEALTMALASGFKGDSVASGLHDIADAIRELADAVARHDKKEVEF